jgi:superfamily II DNA helicase RecQ
LDEHKDIETGTYPLIVATDSFGMRGIDYRSKVGITLVLAVAFENASELEQGMSRVGRDGDSCHIAAVAGLA